MSSVLSTDWLSVSLYSERSVWVKHFWLEKSEKHRKWKQCPRVSTRLIYQWNLPFTKSLTFIVFQKATQSAKTLNYIKQCRTTILNLFWKHSVKHTLFHLCFQIYDNFLGKYSNGQVWSQQHFWGEKNKNILSSNLSYWCEHSHLQTDLWGLHLSYHETLGEQCLQV